MSGTNLSKYSTAELRGMMKGAPPEIKVQIATEIRNRPDGEDMMPSGDLEKPMPKKMKQKKTGSVKKSVAKPAAKQGETPEEYRARLDAIGYKVPSKMAKGGMANCGASVKPNRMAKK